MKDRIMRVEDQDFVIRDPKETCASKYPGAKRFGSAFILGSLAYSALTVSAAVVGVASLKLTELLDQPIQDALTDAAIMGGIGGAATGLLGGAARGVGALLNVKNSIKRDALFGILTTISSSIAVLLGMKEGLDILNSRELTLTQYCLALASGLLALTATVGVTIGCTMFTRECKNFRKDRQEYVKRQKDEEKYVSLVESKRKGDIESATDPDPFGPLEAKRPTGRITFGTETI